MPTDIRELYGKVRNALDADDMSILSETLADIHVADIAEIYESLDEERRSRLLFALPARVTAELVTELDDAERGEVVEEMDAAELTELTSQMEPDDAADVLGDLPEAQRDEILEKIEDDQADKIKELLTYPEDSAGGIMTTDFLALTADATVGEAIREIRTSDIRENLNNIYVADEAGKLTGMLPLRRLVVNEKYHRLGDICTADPVSVHVTDDQEQVIHVISKYDFVSVPVIDDESVLVGIVTHDDIMDVYEEEADEDIYRMAGLDASEFETPSIVRAATIRFSWLVPCIASMAITAAVMMLSQGWFDRMAVYTALIIFVPMIGAIGGNCGIQISTVIVRGLASGELASSRFVHAFKRESRIALVMAPACGVAAWGICQLGLPMIRHFSHGPASNGKAMLAANDPAINRIALAVGIGMTCAILIAAFLGMILPFVFRRIKVDPAIASGPIVTTANDIISVSIFLGLASLIVVM